jgi:hypothetical protein
MKKKLLSILLFSFIAVGLFANDVVVVERDMQSYCQTNPSDCYNGARMGYMPYSGSSGNFYVKDGYYYDYDQKKAFDYMMNPAQDFDWEDAAHYGEQAQEQAEYYNAVKSENRASKETLKDELSALKAQLSAAFKEKDESKIRFMMQKVVDKQNEIRDVDVNYIKLRFGEKKTKKEIREEYKQDKSATREKYSQDKDQLYARLKQEKSEFYDLQKKSRSEMKDYYSTEIDKRQQEKKDALVYKRETIRKLKDDRDVYRIQMIEYYRQLETGEIDQATYDQLYGEAKTKRDAIYNQMDKIRNDYKSKRERLSQEIDSLRSEKKVKYTQLRDNQKQNKEMFLIEQKRKKAELKAGYKQSLEELKLSKEEALKRVKVRYR